MPQPTNLLTAEASELAASGLSFMADFCRHILGKDVHSAVAYVQGALGQRTGGCPVAV